MVGIVVGLIAVYQFAIPKPAPPPVVVNTTPPSPPPAPEPSFLETVTGSYTLAAWTPVVGPMELGVRMPEGSLTIQPDGTMDWSVLLLQDHVTDPGKVRITARARLQLDSRRAMGVPGGAANNTAYLDNKWGQLNTGIQLAVRGWESGRPEDPFRLAVQRSSGQVLLQMSNSSGTYTWTKR